MHAVTQSIENVSQSTGFASAAIALVAETMAPVSSSMRNTVQSTLSEH